MTRFAAAFVATALIVVNFLLVVAFVASLVSLRNLEKVEPQLKARVSTSEHTEAFYNGYLASFILMGCLLLAPVAFRMLAGFQARDAAAALAALAAAEPCDDVTAASVRVQADAHATPTLNEHAQVLIARSWQQVGHASGRGH